MNLLDKIIQHKHQEIKTKSELYPIKLLEQSLYFESSTVSLKSYITRTDKSGIIAEFKRASPSKGDINPYANIEETSIGYMQAGASALSVLTDNHFFKGLSSDLTIARQFNYCPILRKDFILDEYQIIESKSIGADAILLIARILTKAQIKQFTQLAHQLGLEVLLEIHHKSELDKLPQDIQMVGINNRDLDRFKVDFDHSIRLAESLPNNVVKIAESGISTPEDIHRLKTHGFSGFLIGELFMKTAYPSLTCKQFIHQINQPHHA